MVPRWFADQRMRTILFAGERAGSGRSRRRPVWCSKHPLAERYGIRILHGLLGHRDVKTMMIHTHVPNRGNKA